MTTTPIPHAERCSTGRARNEIVPGADIRDLSLPRGRRVLVTFDDQVGGRVVVSETVAIGATLDSPGAPTLALTTTGDVKETARALLCRAMAAELVDALQRWLADPVPPAQACDASRDNSGHLHLQLAATLRAIAEHDHAYDERYPLVWRALALAAAIGMPCGVSYDPDQPECPVVMIELPTGQVGWHVPQHGTAYDGHTTGQKFARLDQYHAAVSTGRYGNLVPARADAPLLPAAA
ncbi:hypothetical protein [Dactylosporangium sp. CS-033363]|uniref:hypothetical protein n=1 Tax=Dactylosporangium sp. CS-033363 TaxID=3239935 RepID=UPI003D922D61